MTDLNTEIGAISFDTTLSTWFTARVKQGQIWLSCNDALDRIDEPFISIDVFNTDERLILQGNWNVERNTFEDVYNHILHEDVVKGMEPKIQKILTEALQMSYPNYTFTEEESDELTDKAKEYRKEYLIAQVIKKDGDPGALALLLSEFPDTRYTIHFHELGTGTL